MILGSILIIVALCAAIFSGLQYLWIELFVSDVMKNPRGRLYVRVGFTILIVITSHIIAYALITHQFIGALCATIFFGLLLYFLIKLFALADAIKNPRGHLYARVSFTISTFAVGTASVILIYALVTHQFQVSYVSQYSSLNLPLGYLISAFWAGQQGTFLLWILLISVMGQVFIRTARQFENYGMLFINIIQALLLAILVKRSPFELLQHVPPDGAGLNPLLQSPWMVVHPPILFIGYAAMAFPFAIALAALSRREYGSWIYKALPWALFTAVMLGAGIVIGGFWAYEVLGWGGYWGWDPVENSSLIPLLTVLALVHGLLIQKNKGALQRTNFFLAILSFILVVYATFLTRSGILADFSVHSFQDLGINTFLILFAVVTTLFGAGMLGLRFGEIPAARIDSSSLNRQNALFFSMCVLCASALVTWVGTSLPIITKLFGKISQVDIAFYNKVNLPIGILMALLLGITPWLMWKEDGYFNALRRSIVPFILGILTAIFSLIAGITEVEFLLFAFASGFAFWTNLHFAGPKLEKRMAHNRCTPFAYWRIVDAYWHHCLGSTYKDETDSSYTRRTRTNLRVYFCI